MVAYQLGKQAIAVAQFRHRMYRRAHILELRDQLIQY